MPAALFCLLLGSSAAALRFSPPATPPAAAAHPAARASPPVAGFWSRIRGRSTRTAPPPSPSPPAATPSTAVLNPPTPGLTHLEDEAAYRAKLAQAECESRVVCIKFYASWCRACKAMAPKYKRVADDWPEIEFCEVLFDTNKALCKGLGIKVLPYIEVVAGSAGKASTDLHPAGPVPPHPVPSRRPCSAGGGLLLRAEQDQLAHGEARGALWLRGDSVHERGRPA